MKKRKRRKTNEQPHSNSNSNSNNQPINLLIKARKKACEARQNKTLGGSGIWDGGVWGAMSVTAATVVSEREGKENQAIEMEYNCVIWRGGGRAKTTIFRHVVKAESERQKEME